MSQWDALRERFCPHGWTLERAEPGSRTWILAPPPDGDGDPLEAKSPAYMNIAWKMRCSNRRESEYIIQALLDHVRQSRGNDSMVRAWMASGEPMALAALLLGKEPLRVDFDAYCNARIEAGDARGRMARSELVTAIDDALAAQLQAKMDRQFRKGKKPVRKVL